MTNLWMFFVFVWINGVVLSFVLDGVTGIATATLTATMTKTSTVVMVDSTSNWLSIDHLQIDHEVICYTGKTATTFTGLTRGCKSTQPDAHASGTRVYSEGSNLINQVIGFNIVQVLADDGIFKGGWEALKLLPQVIKRIVSKLILWDFAYLTGPGVYLKYLVLYPISAGLIITLIQLTFRRGG